MNLLLQDRGKKTFFNLKRLRDYPRLLFITIWMILIINVIFGHGWIGALNQVIGSDFITLYSAGLSYRTDIATLYNISDQYDIQQALIEPTKLPGINPFISPPYVAEAYSIFTFLPLRLAFIVWTFLSLGFTLSAAYLSYSILPLAIKSKMSFWQLLIIVLSFFPFIEGFQVGQNHTLTFLLLSALLVFMLSEHWFPAGIMAGLMIYKPHLVIGIIILWIVWRKYKALAGFAITALAWAGSIYLLQGIGPYESYLALSRDLFLLPYLQGFPGYLLTTLYGLLASFTSVKAVPVILPLTTIIAGASFVGLGWLAFRYRKVPILDTTPVIVLAVLIPIFLSPYSLLHDLLIIVPVFALWARFSPSRNLLNIAIAVYLSAFFLSLLCVLTKIALFALISFGLILLISIYIYRSYISVQAGKTV